MSCPRCRGEAAQEGVYGPENPDRVNAPEPFGEPANIRTELAKLQSELMDLCYFIHNPDDPDKISVTSTMAAQNSALKKMSAHILALDAHLKQVDARLDDIEKRIDWSSNSK